MDLINTPEGGNPFRLGAAGVELYLIIRVRTIRRTMRSLLVLNLLRIFSICFLVYSPAFSARVAVRAFSIPTTIHQRLLITISMIRS